MNTLSDPGKKIARKFESLLCRRDKGYALPLTAEIDLTWRCALNCKGCHSKWLHQDQELTSPQVQRVLTQLRIHGCESVTWSGGGDPLESPIWREAMELAFMQDFKQGLYSYIPQPSQEKIRFIESFCEFVYSHPFQTRGLERKDRSCTWTAGFLLDNQNWNRFPQMVETVDLGFFDYVDFRPLCPTNQPSPRPLNYGWIPEFLELFEAHYGQHRQVTAAQYKFMDLLKPNGGRDYEACYSTDFVAVVGPSGDVYECVNRRGFPDSVLGNLLDEDLETIWRRKTHSRQDFGGCRVLCRNHEMNKELYQILGPAPKHEAFV